MKMQATASKRSACHTQSAISASIHCTFTPRSAASLSAFARARGDVHTRYHATLLRQPHAVAPFTAADLEHPHSGLEQGALRSQEDVRRRTKDVVGSGEAGVPELLCVVEATGSRHDQLTQWRTIKVFTSAASGSRTSTRCVSFSRSLNPGGIGTSWSSASRKVAENFAG